MKITVDAKTLLATLKATVSGNRSFPVLAFCNLTAVESIWLQGTDLDIGTTHALPGTVLEIGSVLAPHKILSGILAGESGEVIIESLENNGIGVTIGDCQYKLVGEKVGNFPKIPSPNEAKPFALVSCQTLKTHLDRTSFAIAKEESRYSLQAAQLIVSRESFRVVATDGHRISVASSIGEFNGAGSVLVSSAAIAWLRNNLPDDGDTLILTDAETVHFVAPSALLAMRKMGQNFPKWEDVIHSLRPAFQPEKITALVTLQEPGAIVKSLARLSKVMDSVAARWHINGKVRVSAKSTLIGEAAATLSAYSDHADAPEMQVGMNVGYVSEYLKLTQSGKKSTIVEMRVRDAQTAVYFTVPGLEEKGQAWEYALMPMRI